MSYATLLGTNYYCLWPKSNNFQEQPMK